jgi:hypothetical protein
MARFLFISMSVTGISAWMAWAAASAFHQADPDSHIAASMAQDWVWMTGLACMAVGVMIQMRERFVFKRDGDD